MTPLERYYDLCRRRNAIISENRSRRMRAGPKLPPLPVPPKPEVPMVAVCYEPDGTYGGVLSDPADCPAGWTVRMEPAVR